MRDHLREIFDRAARYPHNIPLLNRSSSTSAPSELKDDPRDKWTTSDAVAKAEAVLLVENYT